MANTIITNSIENKVATINDVYNWLKPDYYTTPYRLTTFLNTDQPTSVDLDYKFINIGNVTTIAKLTYKFAGSYTIVVNGSSIKCWRYYLETVSNYVTASGYTTTYSDIESCFSFLYIPCSESTNFGNAYININTQLSFVTFIGYTRLSRLNRYYALSLSSGQSNIVYKSLHNCNYTGIEHANQNINSISPGSIVGSYSNTSKKGIKVSEYLNMFGLSDSGVNGNKCQLQHIINNQIQDRIITIAPCEHMEPYNNGNSVFSHIRSPYTPRIYPFYINGVDSILKKQIPMEFKNVVFICNSSQSGGYFDDGGPSIKYKSGEYQFGNVWFSKGQGQTFSQISSNVGRFKTYKSTWPAYREGCAYEGKTTPPMIPGAMQTQMSLTAGDKIYCGVSTFDFEPYISPAIIKTGNTNSVIYNNKVEYVKYDDAIKWYNHPTLKSTKLNDVTGLDDSYKIQQDSKGNAVIPVVSVHSGLWTSYSYGQDGFTFDWSTATTSYYISKQVVGELSVFRFAYRSSASFDHCYTSNDLSQEEFDEIVDKLRSMITVTYHIGLYARWQNIGTLTQSIEDDFDISLDGKIDENGNTITIKNEPVSGNWSSIPYNPSSGNGYAGLGDSWYKISIKQDNGYFFLGYTSTSYQAAYNNKSALLKEYNR